MQTLTHDQLCSKCPDPSERLRVRVLVLPRLPQGPRPHCACPAVRMHIYDCAPDQLLSARSSNEARQARKHLMPRTHRRFQGGEKSGALPHNLTTPIVPRRHVCPRESPVKKKGSLSQRLPNWKKNCLHFSICACHPCAGAMLMFSVSFQF